MPEANSASGGARVGAWRFTTPHSGINAFSTPSWSRQRADDEVDELLDPLGAVVEARRREQHDRAGAPHAQQVLEMDRRERRLARDEHELAALLERHVRGPVDQVRLAARRDRADASPSRTGRST